MVAAVSDVAWTTLALAGIDGAWVGYASTATWFMSQGVPPYIYLAMNTTIRAEVLALFGLASKRPTASTSMQMQSIGRSTADRGAQSEGGRRTRTLPTVEC